MVPVDESFCEFYGLLAGDGCISRYVTQKRERYELRIDGSAFTDVDYYRLFVIPLIKKLTGKELKIKYRTDCNGICLRMKDERFATFLNEEHGFPFGKKRGSLLFPEYMLKRESYRRALLRGFFDTDGSLYFTRNNAQKIRNYPIIELSTHDERLLHQLFDLLTLEGFKPVFSYYGDSVKLHGRQSFLNWFELIGSSHPVRMRKYSSWLRNEMHAGP